MERRLERIRQDVKSYGRGIICAGAYVILWGGFFRLPICPMVYVTGLPCPACGMTRAALLFLQGDFSGAWQMHPFFYILLAWGLLSAVLRYGMMVDISWMKYLAVAIIISAVIFYFYRMWMYFPTSEPMVYEPRSLVGRIKKLHIFQ